LTRGIKGRLQDSILKRRGLAPSTQGGLRSSEPAPADPNKTLAMRLLEAQFGVSIEELLQYGTLAETGKHLGIDESTVSKWRLALGLRNKVYQSGE